jgi:hypothetical protein
VIQRDIDASHIGWRFHFRRVSCRSCAGERGLVTRLDLVADCGACAALCCELLAFDAGEAFGFDKPAGVRCLHVLPTNRCGIHACLAPAGFGGCAAYDCRGAGPRATRLFAREVLDDRQREHVFAVLRELHDLMWLLDRAAARCREEGLRGAIAAEIDALDALAEGSAASVITVDASVRRARVRELLAPLRRGMR